MPMDEVIRAVEQADLENLQDLIDALIRRYGQLYHQRMLVMISLPKDDPEGYAEQLKRIAELLSKCGTADQVEEMNGH